MKEEKNTIIEIDELGRIAIPVYVREKLKLKEGTRIELIIENEMLKIKKYERQKE